jgi:hypothetical protein
LSPEDMEKGSHWMTLRLKNESQESLHNLDIKMHSLDSFHISFRNPNEYIHHLKPEEERYLYFQVEATATTSIYVSIDT